MERRMQVKILAILAGMGFLYYSANAHAVRVFYHRYYNGDYSTTPGDYKEFLTRGYDIQPNRPGVWKKGCRTDNYYCMAQLEHCNVYEQTRGRRYYSAPAYYVIPPQGIEFKEPGLLKEHR